MRILHVGSGFRPMRRGGLVAYVEDLIDAQVARGDDVSYFFSGRQYPLARGPRLRRWDRRGAAMLEVINSPLYDHGRQPVLEVGEARLERLFADVLAEVRPDVVHVQELPGLPSSLLDVVRDAGAASVVTLQDYFPLCSTFRLLDADGRVCMRREIGADCVATTAADARPPGLMIDATVHHGLRGAPLLRGAKSPRVAALIQNGSRLVGQAEAARRERRSPSVASPAAFQRRREVNVERLSRADVVIAMSHRVAEIYAQLGVDPERLRTVHLTLAHIERLRPRPARERRGPFVFATLGGFESEAKGGRLLIDAMRLLAAGPAADKVRLLVLGHKDPDFVAEASGVPGIEIGPHFEPAELDSLLDRVDVGLMPSIWEEAYGYAGVEFLAKGIPVIANAIGGMVDYVRDGETGWLNRSCSAAELARIVAAVAERPESVAELSSRVLAARDSLVKPMARHADEMAEIYAEAAGRA